MIFTKIIGYDDIGLCAQNKKKPLSSEIVERIERVHVIVLIIITWTSFSFCTSTLIMKHEMTIFAICNYLLDSIAHDKISWSLLFVKLEAYVRPHILEHVPKGYAPRYVDHITF